MKRKGKAFLKILKTREAAIQTDSISADLSYFNDYKFIFIKASMSVLFQYRRVSDA